jgi:uncharacterized pyridoxal phosphate-containing UPF0001 family protein
LLRFVKHKIKANTKKYFKVCFISVSIIVYCDRINHFPSAVAPSVIQNYLQVGSLKSTSSWDKFVFYLIQSNDILEPTWICIAKIQKNKTKVVASRSVCRGIETVLPLISVLPLKEIPVVCPSL